MPFDLLILALNLVSTLFMVGLIWFVQIVHYPLFKSVGESEFVEYQLQHQKLTTWVVAGPMLLEAERSFTTINASENPTAARIEADLFELAHLPVARSDDSFFDISSSYDKRTLTADGNPEGWNEYFEFDVGLETNGIVDEDLLQDLIDEQAVAY